MDAADLRLGVRDVAPVLLGMIPFGFVVGVAATDAGLGLGQAVGMSAVVFAGAAQLAALELLESGAPLAVVVATAVVVNLRMLLYSASIAPYFGAVSLRWRAVMAHVLTDPAFALSVARYRADEGVDRRAYFLGVGVTLWGVWLAATAGGVVLGAGVPAAFGLEFAVPLVFLALTAGAVSDRATAVAAGVGGTAAVAARALPLNGGLLAGAVVGVAAGLVTEAATGGRRAE